jgi:hypothetical protein
VRLCACAHCSATRTHAEPGDLTSITSRAGCDDWSHPRRALDAVERALVFTRRQLVVVALMLPGITLAARTAEAAACCSSAASGGVGRLLIWEDFAVGLQLGHARSLGQADASGALRWNPAGFSDGLTQAMPWAIVRLHERVQVQGWAPVVLNDRTSDGTRQLAWGFGDVGGAARFELLSIGEYLGLPSLAITTGFVAPTGRRVEQTRPPLFAGTTGRGAWGLGDPLGSFLNRT